MDHSAQTRVPAPATLDRGDFTVTRAVKALLAWHDKTARDMEAVVGLPKSTTYRRFERGGWDLGEVRALAYYFGVSVDQLTEGTVNLSESRIADEPVRISREIETAGQDRFSGSDAEAMFRSALDRLPRQQSAVA